MHTSQSIQAIERILDRVCDTVRVPIHTLDVPLFENPLITHRRAVGFY